MDISREIFWNIPDWAVTFVYFGGAIAISFLCAGFLRYILCWKICDGTANFDFKNFSKKFFVNILAQKMTLREKKPGLIHLAIFAGFSGLIIVTTIVAIDYDTPINLYSGLNYIVISFFAEVCGIFLIIGSGIVLYRRFAIPFKRKENKLDDIGIPLALILIVLSGFIVEGMRIASVGEEYEGWSFVGFLISIMIRISNINEFQINSLHFMVWMFHLIISLLFIAVIPFSKLRHILASPLNILITKSKENGLPIFPLIHNIENKENIGVAAPSDLSWTDVLEGISCTACSRCNDYCPAYQSGQNLSPKKIIQNIKDDFDREKSSLINKDIKCGSIDGPNMQDIWACTTCGGCVEMCPVANNPLGKINQIRTGLTSKGNIPTTATQTLESIQYLGNPWELNPRNREDWVESLKLPEIKTSELEIIYWSGCSVLYNNRFKEISLAFLNILKHAKIKFKVIDKGISCCGEPARRLGEEALFQKLAQDNILNLDKYIAKTIVTHCPHCYHVLKNEYPKLGGNYNVMHHSEFLYQLLIDRKISLSNQWEQDVIYHDPCYLGRHGKIYEKPRLILNEVPKLNLIEFEKNKDKAFCCGGGGGQIWLEQETGERPNYIRFNEAEKMKPQVIATACPYCNMMLENACSYRGLTEKVKIQDICELLEVN